MKLVCTGRFALAVSFVAVLAVACSAAVAYCLSGRPRAELEQAAPAPAPAEKPKTVAPWPKQLDEARQGRQAANQQFWADKLPVLIRCIAIMRHLCNSMLDKVQEHDQLYLSIAIRNDIHPKFDTEELLVIRYFEVRSGMVDEGIQHMCDEAFALERELRQHDDLPDDVRAHHLAELDRLMTIAKQAQRFDLPDWEAQYKELLKAMGKSEPVRPGKNG